VLSDHGLDAHDRAQDVSTTPASHADHPAAKPVAITMADHIAGEYGYCQFLVPLACGVELYAATTAAEIDRKPAAL
jgi:hypothetical protein